MDDFTDVSIQVVVLTGLMGESVPHENNSDTEESSHLLTAKPPF